MMKTITCLVFFLYANLGYSWTHGVTCDEPYGLRIDFFLANKLGLENLKFLSSTDKITAATPKIFFSKNKALIILEDTQIAGGEPHLAFFNYLSVDEDQISLVGILNGAPYLISYYPKMDIIYISTQKVMFTAGYNANGTLFSSSCQKPFSKFEFEQDFLKKHPENQNTLDKLDSF